MIGRSNRFHGRGGIQRLQRNGKSVRFGAFALRYAPNPQRKSYRLAVVVSRKVSKSAVVRNRIRRRLYERVRILSNTLVGPYDLAVMVYDEHVASMAAEALDAELAKLFKKAKLTQDNPGRHAIVESKE